MSDLYYSNWWRTLHESDSAVLWMSNCSYAFEGNVRNNVCYKDFSLKVEIWRMNLSQEASRVFFWGVWWWSDLGIFYCSGLSPVLATKIFVLSKFLLRKSMRFFLWTEVGTTFSNCVHKLQILFDGASPLEVSCSVENLNRVTTTSDE